MRSRFQNLNEMDAPTIHFVLEQNNGQSRFIHSIRDDNGNDLTEPSEIRERAVDFYSNLYASEYQEDFNIAQKFFEGLPKVPAEINTKLEQPLLLPELSSDEYGQW